MQRPTKRTLNQFTKQTSNAGIVRVVGGRYWVIFTPSAARTLELRVGQRFKVKDVKSGSLTLEPVAKSSRTKPKLSVQK